MNLNQKFTSLAKIGFKYNEFVENAQNEESAVYFKGNKYGKDVPIKKTNNYDKYCTGVEEGVVTGGGAHVCPPPFQKWGRGNKRVCAPPTFGQYICSNFAICSQFVFRNAILKKFLGSLRSPNFIY